MATLSVVLLLTVLVVASSVVARIVPAAVPRPLVQIALGVLVSLLTSWHVQLDPEIFFLLFLPPLLFLDGWRIPPEELYKDRATIAGLALGLVVLTIVAAGLLINATIPAMPLPVAFALAAIVSPTDPIAVSAIASRVPIPRRMMRILEGESLLNDATGLVGMRFAVAAAMTGAFSLRSAALTLLWVALGGVGTGIAITYIVVRAQAWSSARLGGESGSQILTSLLIPFAAYVAAERFHCSGILSAVAAGLTMSVTTASRGTLAATRLRGNAVWDLVQFAVNGIIFVLLGLQLPGITRDADVWMRTSGEHSHWELVLAVAAITAGLSVLRFVWVRVTFRFTMPTARGQDNSNKRGNWRLTGAFTMAGVRGAVTLAGVLTLPLTMSDGSPFPARAIAVFLAASVIVLPLVVASLGLPLLLKGLHLPADTPDETDADRARTAAARAGLAAIQREIGKICSGEGDAELSVHVAARLMDEYHSRVTPATPSAGASSPALGALRIERELRIVALNAERDEIYRLMRARELGSATGRRLVHAIDLTEARLRV